MYQESDWPENSTEYTLTNENSEIQDKGAHICFITFFKSSNFDHKKTTAEIHNIEQWANLCKCASL
jgi:hypothetical protein